MNAQTKKTYSLEEIKTCPADIVIHMMNCGSVTREVGDAFFALRGPYSFYPKSWR